MKSPSISPNRLMIFAVVGAGVALFVAAKFDKDHSFWTSFILTFIVVVVGGVAVNLISDWIRSRAKEPPPDAAAVFQNNHIRDLICQAIVSSVEKELEPGKLDDKHGSLTDRFRDSRHVLAEHYKKTIADPACPVAELSEKKITVILRRHVAGDKPLLTRKNAWQDFIASLPGAGDLSATEQADLTEAFECHFGTALWELAKHDFETGGKAFAGIHLLFQTQNADKIDELLKARPAEVPMGRLHTLRPPPDPFTGRTDELDKIHALAESGSAVITGLKGMGGIGKTALARELARIWAPRYPDAQLEFDGKGLAGDAAPTAARLMELVILAFHPDEPNLPEDPAALVGRYHSVLHGKKVLILLDNAKDAAQAAPLLPPAGCALIVTSRVGFMVGGSAPIAVGRMKAAEAAELLGESYPHLTDPETADLIRLCAGLPLALRLAAAHLKLEAMDRNGYADVAGYLQKLGGSRLVILDDEADGYELEAIQETLRLSIEPLPEVEKRAWEKLAIFTVSFCADAAETIAGADETMLNSFLRRSLLEADGTDRYRLHDLAADYARQSLTEEEIDTLTLSHAAHYTAVAGEADSIYLKGDQVAGLALFDRERPQIEAAWQALAKREDEPAAQYIINLVSMLAHVCSLRFHARQQIKWREAQLRAARRYGYWVAESWALGNLGNAHFSLGDTRTAIGYYEKQLEVIREFPEFREIADLCGEAAALGNLGLAHAAFGEEAAAIGYYEQQLKIAREVGDRCGEANSLGNIGNAHNRLGDARKAIVYCEQQLKIAREIGDRLGEGNSLGGLGSAYRSLGDPRTAISYHEESLVIARELKNRGGEGDVLGNLGVAYGSIGDGPKAIEYFKLALEIARETGDRRLEGNVLYNSALAYNFFGKRAEALKRVEEALAIFIAIEDPNAAAVQNQLIKWKYLINVSV